MNCYPPMVTTAVYSLLTGSIFYRKVKLDLELLHIFGLFELHLFLLKKKLSLFFPTYWPGYNLVEMLIGYTWDINKAL